MVNVSPFLCQGRILIIRLLSKWIPVCTFFDHIYCGITIRFTASWLCCRSLRNARHVAVSAPLNAQVVREQERTRRMETFLSAGNVLIARDSVSRAAQSADKEA